MRHLPRRAPRPLLVAVCGCLSAPVPAAGAAQVPAAARGGNVLANAAVGAATAGVRAAVRRRPVAAALLRGAAGGAVLSAGKQLAGMRFAGAGAVGRGVTAAGIAALTTTAHDTLAILVPLGPLTVEVRPGAADRVRPRLNLWTTVVTAASLLDGYSRLDARASLSAATPVFVRPGDRMPWGTGEGGFAHPGVIFVNRDELHDASVRRRLLAHETVHVLQWDAYHAAVTRDVERAALRRVPGGRFVVRYAEPNALAPLSMWALASRIPYERQPWEREAYRLSGEPLP